METGEGKEEEKHGATDTHQPHSTTDGLLSSCFPAILGKKQCSSAVVDDDGEVYSKANTKSEPTEGRTSDVDKPAERTVAGEGNQQYHGGSEAKITAQGDQQHQGGSQTTVTAQLLHQGGDHKAEKDDDEEEKDCFYSINQNRPGMAVLIGHSLFDTGEKERKGAHMDLRNTFEVFQRLGFVVKFFWDEEVVSLQHQLKQLSVSEEMKQSDCFVCVISTHGSEQKVAKGDRNPHLPGNIQQYEHFLSMKNGVMKTRELLEIFDDSHCKALRGKPRLFFMQVCRSRSSNSLLEGMDPGVHVNIVAPKLRGLPSQTLDFMGGSRSSTDVQGHQESSSAQESHSEIDTGGFMPPVIERDGKRYYEHTPPFPLFEDIVEVVPPLCPNNFLVMFAAPSEMVAWSEDKEGGWLISALYLEFMKYIRHGERITLLPTLTDVSRRVAYNYASRVDGTAYHGMKSVPCLEHKLTKDIHFTPKV